MPSNDELAQLDDPAGELRPHLRHLCGRAEQRVCDTGSINGDDPLEPSLTNE